MRDALQWLIVAALPLLIGGIFLGPAILLLPVGGVVGVGVGVISNGTPFTIAFKVGLLSALLGCVLLFVTGCRHRHAFWGKASASLAVYLWCAAGLVGFGPQ